MPRQARLDFTGALHHVVVQGIDNIEVFAEKADKQDFVERLAFLVPETKMACYAWSLTTNQIQLLVKSGGLGLSHFMRRLLTGYVVHFNKKYKRHGPLFQNRFKSLLCQEDSYFKELLRVVHLAPIEAGIVKTLQDLKKYEFSGHGTIMNTLEHFWQDSEHALSFFAQTETAARKKYQSFIKEGFDKGVDLKMFSGGLVKNPAGWTESRKSRVPVQQKVKGDERILGDFKFVTSVLSRAKQPLDEAYKLKGKGIDFADVEKQATRKFGIKKIDLYSKSRKQHIVNARSVFMFWANRKLGFSCTELARRFKLTQPAVSYAVERGEKIVKERKLRLIV